MTEPPPTDYVQSLARGLTLIRVFDAEHPRQTLSEFAKVTSPHARNGTALLTLVELGYVRTDGSVSR